MPDTSQLARPSSNTEDPHRRLRRPVVIVTWVAAAVIPTAVLYIPGPAAAAVATAMAWIVAATAYKGGLRVGVAFQRQACREGRRRG